MTSTRSPTLTDRPALRPPMSTSTTHARRTAPTSPVGALTTRSTPPGGIMSRKVRGHYPISVILSGYMHADLTAPFMPCDFSYGREQHSSHRAYLLDPPCSTLQSARHSVKLVLTVRARTGLQHVPRQRVRSHCTLHRRLYPRQNLLHPQWQCVAREAELSCWLWLGPVDMRGAQGAAARSELAAVRYLQNKFVPSR